MGASDALTAIWPLALVFGTLLAASWLQILVKKWLRSISPLASISDIELMTGEDFEKLLRKIFERDGWRVQLTPKFGDFGADLILEDGSTKLVIQAKRWKKPVGVRAVQEAAAARDLYGADLAWVVTNSTFTQAAHRQARASRVALYDGKWLGQKISGLQNSKAA